MVQKKVNFEFFPEQLWPESLEWGSGMGHDTEQEKLGRCLRRQKPCDTFIRRQGRHIEQGWERTLEKPLLQELGDLRKHD